MESTNGSSQSSMDVGLCAVCAKSASLRCAGCRKRFYCDKEHQRCDWSEHKLTCRAWEIRESEGLGRHLIASRDLDEGDMVIVAEAPIVWGPTPHNENSMVCVGCGDPQVRVSCPGCQWFACKASCEGLVDDNRHGLECKVLAKTRIYPRCDILLILRALLLRRKNPKRWKAFTALQSHEESRGPGTEAHEEMETVAKHLKKLFDIDNTLREILPKVCGIVDVNALETNAPQGSAGVYEIACLLEHNCVANTRHSFCLDDKGRPRITVTAVTSIKKGEHLSTMYTHALWSTRARREHLLATKYFSCRCKRCADPTELGSHLGTLKCLCGNGFVLPKDPLDIETDWSCTACPASLVASEVTELMERLAYDVETVMIKAKEESLSELLERLGVLLHPGHQHCVWVGHTLVQLMSPDDPEKPKICQRIIDSTTILDPYGTRLPLYTAVALRELALCPGQDRKELLERALHLLRHEPPHGPGEELRRVVESQLMT